MEEAQICLIHLLLADSWVRFQGSAVTNGAVRDKPPCARVQASLSGSGLSFSPKPSLCFSPGQVTSLAKRARTGAQANSRLSPTGKRDRESGEEGEAAVPGRAGSTEAG